MVLDRSVFDAKLVRAVTLMVMVTTFLALRFRDPSST
jgi:hypothetical protein